MDKIAQHKILVAGESFANCCDQVYKFFNLTSLVVYDCVQVIDNKCRSAMDSDFFDEISVAETKNHNTVNSLIDELQLAGAKNISDLRNLEHGYPSKLLHIVSHFLDGFIGIDSQFYNLLADSHWVNKDLQQDILASPGMYWLIHVDCYSASPAEAGVLHM